MGHIAWLIVGAIGGYLGGMFVKGDEGMGIIGHILLGIVGAIVGGFIAGFVTCGDYIGQIDLATVLIAALGAIATVVVWKSIPGNAPTGGRVA